MCVCVGGVMLPSRVPCPPYAYAYVCACVCACARWGASAFVCVEGGGGGEVMRPWRVPCSPEKGFLKKRGMSARCTSVGGMLGVGVGECVRVCAL